MDSDSTVQQLAEIRSLWQFVAVSQFLYLYGEALGYKEEEYSTERLEEALLSPGRDPVLLDLHRKLLKSYFNRRDITFDEWEDLLKVAFLHHGDILGDKSPFKDPNTSYYDLTVKQRILVLHYLCEWQFEDPERFRNQLTTEDDCVHWRIDPVGWDAKGNTYWLFDDNRLYMETIPEPPAPKPKPKAKSKPKAKKRGGRTSRRGRGGRSTRGNAKTEEDEEEDDGEEEAETSSSTGADENGEDNEGNEGEEEGSSNWQLVCLTKEDWEEFPKQFEKSKHPDEKHFYKFLVEHALPKVLEALQKREREMKIQEAIMNRKRSSRLQMAEIAKMEEDDRRTRRELQEREQAERERKEYELLRAEQERIEKLEARERRLREREERLIQEQLEKERIALEREMRAERRRLGLPPSVSLSDLNSGFGEGMGSQQNGTTDTPIDVVTISAGPEKTTPSKSKSKPKSKSKTPASAQNVNMLLGEEGEEDWYFDCTCGVHGFNLEESAPMVACEKCNVWQHIHCAIGKPSDAVSQQELDIWSQREFRCHICTTQNLETKNERKRQRKADRSKFRRQRMKLAAKLGIPMGNSGKRGGDVDDDLDVVGDGDDGHPNKKVKTESGNAVAVKSPVSVQHLTGSPLKLKLTVAKTQEARQSMSDFMPALPRQQQPNQQQQQQQMMQPTLLSGMPPQIAFAQQMQAQAQAQQQFVAIPITTSAPSLQQIQVPRTMPHPLVRPLQLVPVTVVEGNSIATPTTLAAQVLAGLAGFPSPTGTSQPQTQSVPATVTSVSTNGIHAGGLGPITMAQPAASMTHQPQFQRPPSPRPKSPVAIAPAAPVEPQPMKQEPVVTQSTPMPSQIPVRTSRSPSPKPVVNGATVGLDSQQQ